MGVKKIFSRCFILAVSLKTVLLLFSQVSLGQQAEIGGSVTDAFGGDTLAGVNILVDSITVGTTDDGGHYRIAVTPGKHEIIFKFIGYQPEKLVIEFVPGGNIRRDVRLRSVIVELNTAVITASKYEQRLSDVTVSMEVIKPDFIEKQNIQHLDDALRLLPGIDVLDGQASIRGGSGYSYGAGSRVMLLVDDLPMLTGDVNSVKWNYIPVELIGQVEVIKGASSALYGSSALDGVINVRTATPGNTPETTVNVSGGLYTPPARKELSWWWDGVPLFGDIKISHLRKAGPFDIVLGINGFANEGYRTDNYEYYGRVTAGLRYNPVHLKGLSMGIHTSFQLQKSSDFLIWTDADSGALVQNPLSVSHTGGIRFNIDPYVYCYDNYKGRHNLMTRYYKVTNDFPETPDKNNGSDYFYGEYQYQRTMNEMHLSAGAAGSYTLGNSQLYGDHKGSTMALYAQFDGQIYKSLSVSLGLRWERYTLDRTDDESKPVLRAGINYHAAEATYVRASFGQGYRFPSMAEKYTSTSLGSLNIFPNPDLHAETGWSAEAGVRQGFQFGNWSGFLDLAGFWTEYQDMMEFTFGVFNYSGDTLPTLENLGFKSVNVGEARITGIDVSINGQTRAGIAAFNFYAGYTYMNPLDLSSDSLGEQMLKYRYKHSAKGDLEVIVKNFDAGLTIIYQSFMERIDAAFVEKILGQEFFPGLKNYRKKNDHGAVVLDFRVGYQVTPSSRVSLIIKNLLNKEYMGRPGDIQPPRTISLQYILKLGS